MAKENRTFRIAVREYGPFESAIRKQWDTFESRYGTGFELQAIPLDLHSLYEFLFVKRGLMQGDCDAAFVNTDWLAEAAESGALTDLSAYIEDSPPDGYPGAWSESLLRLQRFGSRILGLPYHDGPECLIYRRDLFEDPAEAADFLARYGERLEPPRTWDQFHRVASFFTRPESGLYGTAFAAFSDAHNTVYDFCLQLWTRGGELFDDSGRMMLNTPQAHEALEYYRTIVCDPRSAHPLSRTFDSVRSGIAFARGEVAMTINWFGFAFTAETSPESTVKGRVGIARLPAGSGATASLNVYWVLGMAAGSKQTDIAWKFLRHCASPEMDKLTTLEGAIGCRTSTWSDPQINSLAPFYRELKHLHQVARELPRLTAWPNLAEIIDRMVVDAVDTHEPSVDILQRAQACADAVLATENIQSPLTERI